MDNENLSEECAGGVEIETTDGRIKVVSTLESRMELISGQVSLFLVSLMTLNHFLKLATNFGIYSKQSAKNQAKFFV